MKRMKTDRIQQNIILILAVLLIFAVTTTGTLALYSRFEQDSTNIVLANPVNIYIAAGDEEGTVVLDEGTVAYPGSRVTLNLRFALQSPSSPAFIRAKARVTSDAFVGSGGSIVEEGLIEFTDTDENQDGYPDSKPNPNNWVLVDFNFIDYDLDGQPDDPTVSDIWYVYVEKDATQELYAAKTLTDEDGIQDFIKGTIKISKTLTNEFANKEINITYTVGAIQSANVQPPVSTGSSYYTYDYYKDGNLLNIYIGSWGVEAQD